MSPDSHRKQFFPKVPVLDLAENREMIAEFIAEALKHLLTVKNSILILESMSSDQEATDTIFKAFHTIKGLADFLNLDDIRTLTEETETLVNLVRRNVLKFDNKAASVITQSVDGLHKLIELLNEQLINHGELKSAYYDVSALIKSIRLITDKISPESFGSSVEFQREIPTISMEETQKGSQPVQPVSSGQAGDNQKLNVELEETRRELQRAQGKLAERQRELIRERELSIKLTQQAQATARAKSEYLATMAHEIRTLINAILGFADLVKKGTLNAKQKDHLETITLSGKLLLGIVNDILDFSKVEAGKLKLESIKFDLVYVIEEVFKIIRTRLNKPVNLFFDVRDDVPRCLTGDPTRLKQIFINLIDNSIKFTEKGEIGLTVGVDSQTSTVKGTNAIKLHFVVQDTGIGIPENRRNSIFESFTQADTSITRIYGGSGLGLSLCKNYIETMGGRIWVESEMGKGSRFIFQITLETATPDAPFKPASLPKDLQSKKVYLVDKSARSRETFAKLCKRLNLKLIGSAEQVEEAANTLSNKKETKSALPDIIFVDMMFPEQAGPTLVSRLRQDDRLRETKIVAVSADVRIDTAQYGVDNFLSKPFIDSECVDILEQTFGLKPQDDRLMTPEAVQKISCAGIKILVVEDSLPNQELLKVHFESLGCEVDYVSNGQEAIDKVKNNSYDICFMDLQMPVMGGLQATQIIRKEFKKEFPIIALTAAALEEERQSCLAAGMNDYLAKPFNFIELKEKVIRSTKM